jgi:hypothetical protein
MFQRPARQHASLSGLYAALFAASGLLATALPAAAESEDGLSLTGSSFLAERVDAAPLAATALVYDGITGAALSFTGSTPRTFMGQGFSVADPGGPVQISSMTIVLVAGAAVNYVNTRINVEFWDSYDSTAASGSVFSSPLGINAFTTGPLTTAGATALSFTLTFATPIALTGLVNHGLAVNWQSDAAGTGTFINDTLLTEGLRTTGSANINPGANVTPGSGYYRNVSGATNFNFLGSDARVLSGVTNGGLAFTLTSVSAVPEPGSAGMWLAGLAFAGACAARSRRRRH